jgi:hypothetical protein
LNNKRAKDFRKKNVPDFLGFRTNPYLRLKIVHQSVSHEKAVTRMRIRVKSKASIAERSESLPML